MAYVKQGITEQDCIELVARLREEDLKEILAVKPLGSPLDSLLECLKVSSKSFAVIEEGVGCIAIFGVSKGFLGAMPWLLTSDLLFHKNCRKFIKQCRGYLEKLTEGFNFSYNYVSTTNTKAHRWLAWLGFNLDKTHTYSVNDVAFYQFTFTKGINEYV